ncbi:cellulose synthase subunit BcsC [Aphanothece hegewaldii CCALA 016]|uniref:Cellulose synthase subunit BcsC n=1 Tax=Aphanothece hegewaldii CCALA 016 TaxID=2107694 RepID=A0A2T1LUH5_9CHRO|nr:tetratricopeptide repeat protein [Aphanothece hegewaldii]PSF35198.1 cellulose synthase subunit BcsC [Aphanothece hegewaldii CCALA 016]
MSTSQQKPKRWLSISLAIMVFALVSFSMMPLISSFFLVSNQTNHSLPSSLPSKWDTEALGYQMVLQREPDNQNALRGLLNARLKQGNLREAIAPLEKLAQLNSTQTDYSILLAQVQQQIQDFEGANTTYQTLLASHPEDMRALKGLVDLLLLQNKASQAISLVEQTLAKNKETKQIDVNSLDLLLGEIYVDQQQWDQAIAIYDQAIQTDPKDFRPVLAKALVFREQGQQTLATPLFEEAVMLAPIEYKDEVKMMAVSN